MEKRRLIDIIILIGVVVVAYAYRDQVFVYTRAAAYEVRNFASPCSAPLTYAVGTVDAGFGLTRDQYKQLIEEAAAIWEKPAGKDLFKYSDNGWLKVNLIYDYRQETSSKLQGIGAQVEASRAQYDALRQEYLSLKSQFAVGKSSYDASVAAFEKKSRAHQDQVNHWNQKGGAPQGEYTKLKAEDAALEREFAQLKSQESALNAKTREINDMVARLNAMAKSLNISVDDYNTLGQTLGDSYEEGFYEANGVDRHIDIYEFKDRTALVRVLAHELGHALGFEHVDNEGAIMYSFNKGTNLTLTASDAALVRDLCD